MTIPAKIARIAILHHVGGGNLGDEAIIEAVIRNIWRRCKGAEIAVFSMNPDDTAKRHGVSAFPIRRYEWVLGYESQKDTAPATASEQLLQSLHLNRNPVVRLARAGFHELRLLARSYRRLKTFDVLIVSGGGQLTERGGSWSFPYSLFAWAHLAKASRTPCVFLNIGAGPLTRPLSRFFARRALVAADYVSFRDSRSQSLAASIGFARPSFVFPDNAFGLDVPGNQSAAIRQSPVVGIAPMPFPFADQLNPQPGPQDIQKCFIAKVAAFAWLLTEQSYSLQFFGTDIGADPPEIGSLCSVLQSQHQLLPPEYRPVNSLDELITRMMSMDFVVTCRFHGVVLAALLEKPVMALSHHPKVTELMRTLGLHQYCREMRSFDPEEFYTTFLSLVRNAEDIRERLAEKVLAFRTQLTEQYDMLFSQELQSRAAQRAIRRRRSFRAIALGV
jgi:polysaccharide pyruvyl transferase WcaK-like protein